LRAVATRFRRWHQRDVGDLVTKLHNDGKARNTIRNILSPLCKGLNDAVDRELLTANPAAGIRMPKKTKVREARVPSPAELKKILAKAAPTDEEIPPDTREIITVTASLGLRRGEVFGLKWKDVDLERGLVTIQRQIRAGGQIVEQTKTKAGMRTVPLFASARAVLEARADRLGMPRAWLKNADVWIFPNSIGGPIESSNWSRREWRPALKAAGVEDLHFHDLRHFAASALRDAGMDNKKLSEEQVAKAADQLDPLQEAAPALALSQLEAVLSGEVLEVDALTTVARITLADLDGDHQIVQEVQHLVVLLEGEHHGLRLAMSAEDHWLRPDTKTPK
jgi:integrase